MPPLAPLAAWCAILLLAATGCLFRAEDPPTPSPDQYDQRMTVTMDAFRFAPSTFQFPKGQTVAFDLAAVDSHHTFTVPELGIQWKVCKGRTLPVRYQFTSAGNYRLSCSIEGHDDAGMLGFISVR